MLGVENKATEQELKKAYRKKSLQLHPDKPTGDAEAFKQMKRAYDVLSDPKKRKAYDQHGEAAVKFLEGELSMEVAMQMFLSIDMCTRLVLVLLLTLVIGYLLLFPILLSVRWDHPKAMNFAHVFIPVWVGLGVLLCFLLCCLPNPPCPDLEEEDESMRQEEEEKWQQHIKQVRWIRYGGALVVIFLGVFLSLLVLRLDGETRWSYFLVVWPWILLELGLWAYKFWSAEAFFVLSGHSDVILHGQKWLSKDWNFFVASFTCPHIVHIVFACLVASKMDGEPLAWWEVFSPFWVGFVINSVMILTKCCRNRNTLLEDDPREESTGKIVAQFIQECIWTGCVLLVCLKLSHPHAFPAWVIFLPTFLIAGCFCCCVSCCLCCMSPAWLKAVQEDDEENAGFGQTQDAYGTMGAPYAPPPAAEPMSTERTA